MPIQPLLEVLDLLIGAGWLALLGLNIRELRSYRAFTLTPTRAEISTPVSVVIPARNEERRIRVCLDSLLHQTARNLEIVVLDDRSTDETGRIVREMGEMDSRIVLARGEELPAGWAGKNWACHQGFKKTSLDWILFLDSDTRLEEAAVASTVEYATKERLGALSLVPSADYEGFWPTVAGPVLSWLIRLVYPLRKVNDPSSDVALAVGSFLLFRRKTYLEIGGHAAIKGELVEDKEIANNLKARRVPYRLLIGRRLLETALFAGGQGLWNSLRRVMTNPLKTGRSARMLFALLGLIFLLYPLFLFVINLVLGEVTATDILIAVLSLLVPAVLVGYDIASRSKPSYRFALLASVGAVIVMSAIVRQSFGRADIRWRGRSYAPYPQAVTERG